MTLREVRRLVTWVLVSGLAACASAPPGQTFVERDGSIIHFDPASDPYWKDPGWVQRLLTAIQSQVQDPLDPADMSAPNLHGAVKFTYADGNIEYPEILQSTGRPDMDRLMIRQVASAQVPQSSGIDADVPHVFVLELYMPTPFETFQSSIYAAFDVRKVYPKDAILFGEQGTAAVGFDYQDGELSGIALTKSSRSKQLDKQALEAVTRARLPAPPGAYVGKLLHMETVFCYHLRESAETRDPCPVGRNVIEVTGTRTRHIETERSY